MDFFSSVYSCIMLEGMFRKRKRVIDTSSFLNVMLRSDVMRQGYPPPPPPTTNEIYGKPFFTIFTCHKVKDKRKSISVIQSYVDGKLSCFNNNNFSIISKLFIGLSIIIVYSFTYSQENYWKNKTFRFFFN